MRIITIFCVLVIGLSCKQTAPKKVVEEPLVLHHFARPAAANVTNPPVLILLHGLGSNAKNFFSFSGIIPPEWLVISARAPFTYPNAPKRFKWYDLTFKNGERQTNYQQVEESRQLLLKFIEQVKKKYNVDENRIVIGGFSQGAIMSYNIGLRTPEKVSGIASFSGIVLEKIKPEIKPQKAHQQLKAFVSHGEQDDRLPYSEALEAKNLLESLGVQATYSFDQAKHTISPTHRTAFLAWLSKM